jgi:hypothetical protein
VYARPGCRQAIAGDRLERCNLPQCQLPGPPGGGCRTADPGAAGCRAAPGYACRDSDGPARHLLPLDRLYARAARAGTRERYRCTQCRPHRLDAVTIRSYRRGGVPGAGESAAATKVIKLGCVIARPDPDSGPLTPNLAKIARRKHKIEPAFRGHPAACMAPVEILYTWRGGLSR